MYNLPHFKEKDDEIIQEFIDQHPFALLTGCDLENKPIATQVPILQEEKKGRKILIGHIMRKTDHHKAFLQNDNVRVVFTGGHSYVSATWYKNKRQASTWNYMSVHAKGTIQFLDKTALAEILQKTTLYFEDYNKDSPTIFDNLPSRYKQKAMKAIVAFEIEVAEIENVFKLSQNKDAETYQNIIRELRKGGNQGQVIADEMEKKTDEVFPNE